jgi:hypothetical protein
VLPAAASVLLLLWVMAAAAAAAAAGFVAAVLVVVRKMSQIAPVLDMLLISTLQTGNSTRQQQARMMNLSFRR